MLAVSARSGLDFRGLGWGAGGGAGGKDGFAGGAGSGCGFIGMRGENGFVRNFCEFGAKGFEAVEILDGAAVVAFGLGLVAEEEFPGLRMLGEVNEAFGQGEVLFLGARHLQAGIADIGVQKVDGFGIAGMVEAGGEEAAFRAGGAEEVELGNGDAFDGIEFLAVGRLVDGDEVGAEFEDIVEAFEDRDREVG